MSSLPLNLALFEAVTKSDVDRINQLLSEGASPQWQYDKYGDRTALHKAIENQSSGITEILIKHIVQQAVKSGDATIGSWLSQVLTSSALPSEPVPRSATRGSPHVEYSSLPLKERVERALAAVARGEFVVVMDGEDRENEGDLIMAAEKVTPEQMAFMVNYTSGIICIGITGARAEELKLPQMVAKNTESHSTAFTHSVDYKIGTSTGISASDRAATARAMTDPTVQPDDFSRPGHLFPLRAKDGGVLERPGHTETAVDLARLAGLYPAGILCELVNRDGSMSRAPTCQAFAREHGLQWLTIADLIAYRRLLAAEGVSSPFQLALPSTVSASADSSPASTPKSATYSAGSGDLESSVSVSS